MMSQSYGVRTDERTRLQFELLVPLATVVLAAVIVLFFMASNVPGQFYNRGFVIPGWAAFLAIVGLIGLFGLRMQRPQRYELGDSGIDVILPTLIFRILWPDIVEVVSVSERAAPSLLHACTVDLYKRIRFGLKSFFLRLCGGSGVVNLSKEYSGNYIGSDSGGVSIHCKNGASILISPLDIADFLREIDHQLDRRHLVAKVMREQTVRISSKDS